MQNYNEASGCSTLKTKLKEFLGKLNLTDSERVDSDHTLEKMLSSFEEQLLHQWEDIGCNFDWHLTCSHEISVDWYPNVGKTSDEIEEEDREDRESIDFILQCAEVVEKGNYGLLKAPESIQDIHGLAVALLAVRDDSNVFNLLTQYGWEFEDDSYGSGGGPSLKEIVSHLDDWSIDVDLCADFSGTATLKDPAGVDHEIELPPCEFEDFSDNFRITEVLDILDLFEGDVVAFETFKKLL